MHRRKGINHKRAATELEEESNRAFNNIFTTVFNNIVTSISVQT